MKVISQHNYGFLFRHFFGKCVDIYIVKIEHDKYVNITSASEFIYSLQDDIKLPITHFFLNDKQLNKLLEFKF